MGYGLLTFLIPCIPILLATSRNVLAEYERRDLPDIFACHPWHGRNAKMLISGYDTGSLNEWLSFNNDGHWMIARYTKWTDADPLLFQAAEHCGEYYLQSTWPNMPATSAKDDHWLSFANCGK